MLSGLPPNPQLSPQGCTYQNPKSHDFQQTFQREEGGEDDVEYPQSIFISKRGPIELEEEGGRGGSAGGGDGGRLLCDCPIPAQAALTLAVPVDIP